MYVLGVRSLFGFPDYVVSKASMTERLLQGNLRREPR